MREKIINLKNYVCDMSKYRIQVLQEHACSRKSCQVYVLMFHCVENNRAKWDDSEYCITLNSLKKMLVILKEAGYTFCKPDKIWNENNKKRVVITFDDAYSCIYTEVFGFLKEENIPFLVFQTISFLDQPKYLSTDMIKEMIKYEGFYLGTHTITHCNLHLSNNWKNEIEQPIKMLKDKFGVTCNYFAYPYGAYITLDWKNIIFTSKKYKGAFCTCNTGVFHKAGIYRYLIPRINVNENNYESVIHRMTCGGNG